MRRRDLLAALASGAVAATAGCGYAYGGGDLRGEERISNPGLPSEEFFTIGSDWIVHASSGRQPVWNEDDVTFAEVTEVSAWTRAGERRWSYAHEAPSRAVAAGDDVYVLDGSDHVVAISATAVETERSAERSTEQEYETEERWRVRVDGALRPLVAGDGGAYVAREGGLSAVRKGSVVWDVDLPGTPSSLCALGDSGSEDGGVDGGVVASTAESVVALTADGRDRWRFDTAGDGTVAVAAAAGRTAIRDRDGLAVVRTSDGRDLWSDADLGRRGAEGDDDRPAVTDDAVYVTDYGGVRALDAETGEERWVSGSSAAVEPPLVPGPEDVYAVGEHCEAVAVGADRDGVRWSRTLDIQGSCRPLAGWLDGETVAFLFESGDLRWLQRTDQSAPGSV